MTARETADIAARQDEIFGQPPRILPIEMDQLDKTGWKTAGSVKQAVGVPADDKGQEYHRTMMRYPELYKRHSALAVALFGGELATRDRELLILRIAWLCGAPYEWGEHVKISKYLLHFTEDDFERIIAGPAAPGWSEHERAVLKTVDELRANATISDETWAVLARTLNEKQLIQIPILVGQYQGIAYLQNALRLRPTVHNTQGLYAR